MGNRKVTSSNWDTESGQQESNIYTGSMVPATGWEGRYFPPMTKGLGRVSRHVIAVLRPEPTTRRLLYLVMAQPVQVGRRCGTI